MPKYQKGTIAFTVEQQKGVLIPKGTWTIHIDDLNKVLCDMFEQTYSRDVIWEVVKLKANKHKVQHRVRKKLPSHMGMPKTKKEQKAAVAFMVDFVTKSLNGFDRHIEKFLADQVEEKKVLESPTYEQFWREHHLPGRENGDRTENKFRRWILPVLGPLKMDEIRPHHIDATVKRMQTGAKIFNKKKGKVVFAKGLAMNTIHRTWKELGGVFHTAKSMDLERTEEGLEPIYLRGRFPYDHRRMKNLPKRIKHNQVPPPAEDFITLLAWIKVNDPTMLHITTIALYTGLRVAELIALTWNDVQWESNRVVIDKAWNIKLKKIGPTKTKTKTTRPMISGMKELLLDWKEVAEDKDELIKRCAMSANKRMRWQDEGGPGLGGRLPLCTGKGKYDYIFSHPTGRPFPYNTLIGRLNKALVACGVKRKGQGFHAFRRSWVSELAANLNAKGVDPISLIQQIGGWKSKEVVREYLYDLHRHSHQEQLDSAFDEIYGDKILDLFKKEDDPEEPENE